MRCHMFLGLACSVMIASTAAIAADARREAGAHVHGTGKLGIVIENATVSIELDAPAHDIVGFEHAPETPAEKAAMTKALDTLKAADMLFKLTPAADCRLSESEAGLEQEEKSEAGNNSDQHADINGRFVFTCGAIERLTGIDLGYFAAFPSATKLDIVAVTAKGQVTRAATSSAPRIDLSSAN